MVVDHKSLVPSVVTEIDAEMDIGTGNSVKIFSCLEIPCSGSVLSVTW